MKLPAKYFLLLVLGCCLGSPLLTGQEQRTTEAQVNWESAFLEAKKEQLLGNYDKAIAKYQELLGMDGDLAVVHYNLARLYAEQENMEEAIKEAELAVKEDPEVKWYRELLADLYPETGKLGDAAGVWEGLVRDFPKEESYYYRWALVLVQANLIKEAIAVYDRLEAQVGIKEDIIRQKHNLYFGTGNLKKAGAELEKLAEAFPTSTDYLHLLAAFYERTNDKDRAAQAYRQILQLNPNDSKARLALEGGDPRQQDELEFLAGLKPVFEDPGISIDLKIGRIMPLIGKVVETNDRPLADALLELTALLERAHPGEAKGFAASGDLLYHTGRTDQAAGKYEQALALDESVYQVWEQYLFILYETADFAKLTDRAEAAMDLFPNQAFLYWAAGAGACNLGKNADAVYFLDQAALMTGNASALNADVQSLFGLVLALAGEQERADEAFRAAGLQDERNPLVMARRALALAETGGNLTTAADWCQKAAGIAPELPEVRYAAGRVAFFRGDYAVAAENIRTALNANQNRHPLQLEHYGDVLFKTERTDEAVQYWTLARERGNTSKMLHKKITARQLYE